MKIKSVGPDKVSDYALETLCNSAKDHGVKITNLIYWYEIGNWSGSGLAVYKDNKGHWHKDDLGHCSCFGPFDRGFNAIPYTKQQVIALLKKDRSEGSYVPGAIQLDIPYIIEEVNKA